MELGAAVERGNSDVTQAPSGARGAQAWVSRFGRKEIASGRGRKLTYTAVDKEYIPRASGVG